MDSCLCEFIEAIKECRRAAQLGNKEDYWEKAKKLIGISRFMEEICAVYLELVYPALVEIERKSFVDWKTVTQCESRLKKWFLDIRRKQEESDPRCKSSSLENIISD